MSKILTITTLDTEHARSRTLLSVAEKLGYDARICRLDNPNIITQIIESDGVVYGISERNYPLSGEILTRLASSWQKDLLQAGLVSHRTMGSCAHLSRKQHHLIQ